jgi:hypothetical protein
MGKKNLIPNNERTPEELRENGRKGGIASGEARREKKLAKQIVLEILDETKNVNGKEVTMKEFIFAKYLNNLAKQPTYKDIDFLLALIGEEVERRQTHVIESEMSDEDKKYFAEHFGMNIGEEEK